MAHPYLALRPNRNVMVSHYVVAGSKNPLPLGMVSVKYNGTYFLKHKDFDSLILIYKGDHKEKEDDGIEYSSKYYYYQVVGINSTFNKDVIGHGEFSVSADELEYEGHDVTQETNIKEALTHLESYYASEVTKID